MSGLFPPAAGAEVQRQAQEVFLLHCPPTQLGSPPQVRPLTEAEYQKLVREDIDKDGNDDWLAARVSDGKGIIKEIWCLNKDLPKAQDTGKLQDLVNVLAAKRLQRKGPASLYQLVITLPGNDKRFAGGCYFDAGRNVATDTFVVNGDTAELLVTNLPMSQIVRDELKKFIEATTGAGSVTALNTSPAAGRVFAQFKDKDLAKAALGLDGAEFGGMKLKIQATRDPLIVTVENVSLAPVEANLKDLLKDAGTVVSVRAVSQVGGAYVRMSTRGETNKAGDLLRKTFTVSVVNIQPTLTPGVDELRAIRWMNVSPDAKALNDFEFDVKAKTLKVTVRRQGQEKVKPVKEVPRTPQELQALLDDPPGDLTLDEGEEIPTCSQTDGLPAIVTSFTGTASKVGVDPAPGQDSGAQVRISGKFAFRGTLDLGASTVTLNLLLDESDGAGELVQGIDGADSVPLTLFARGGGTPGAAIFEPLDVTTRPTFRAEIKQRDPKKPIFDFLLRIDRATLPVPPVLCNEQSPTTALTTSFTINDGVNPPVALTTTPLWRCSASQLRVP
jgi:hypothetical protein